MVRHMQRNDLSSARSPRGRCGDAGDRPDAGTPYSAKRYSVTVPATNWSVRFKAPLRTPHGVAHSYDVRLRRELTHRRLFVALVRRFFRVVGLHLLDASLIASLVWVMGLVRPELIAARAYIPALVVVVLAGLNAAGSYSSGDRRRDRKRLLYGVSSAVLILAFLATVPPAIPLELTFLLQFGALAVLALSLGRMAIDQLVRQAYRRGFGLRKAVVVGNLDEVGRAIRQLRDDRNIDQYFLGHITPEDDPDPASLGSLGETRRIVDEMDVQEVIVTRPLSSAQMREISEICFEMGAALYVMPSVSGETELRAEPMRFGECTLLQLHPARLELPALLVKRCFDLIGSAVLIILLAPLMLMVAVAVKLESDGPVFYRSKRVGLRGRHFQMWKFRSMKDGAPDLALELAHLNIYQSGAFKIPNDPRVTRLGRFLRRYSLDELPQLFNVLCGDMSLVGPRPPLPSEVAGYKPHHFERLSVIPGITGPWQVSGRNLITDFDQVVRLEGAYIRSWSLLLDAKILMRTLAVVVRGNGAY